MTVTLPSRTSLAPPARRERRRDHIVLSPVCPTDRVEPTAYRLRLEQSPAEPLEELASIRWTLQALELLAPDAFLLTNVSAPALAHPRLEEELGPAFGRPFLPALEQARTGQRRAEMNAAVANASRLGLRVAVWGHRLQSNEDFHAVVVDRRTAGIGLRGGSAELIVTDVASQADAEWAVDMGGTLIEGPAVGDPIKVAPVDLNRLRR